MVREDKQNIDKLVRLLKVISEALGMEINWEKSCTYWFDKYYMYKMMWLGGNN